ncbi:S-adenosyl-L-homocysteine hydrolase [uncultured Tateyamaria sp.]|uniref:S-adenosyl-L-homocysteine hydrolase n=1 Tax=uncultured Tateyamaria sp. TaxID=455651 RepID=UPI002601D76C|nr:S-adenosyl-L-homocysteine hydrolase [uncultured Tateyamaria sp.]
MKPAIFAFGLSALTLSAAPAVAQTPTVCMSSTEMEATLIDWYGEAPIAETATQSTQVWASDDSGTWTLVQYLADGQSCVLAQGSDWGASVSEDLLLAGLADR